MRSVERKSQQPQQTVTPRTLLAEGVRAFRKARLFYGHGLPDADDEAFYLLLHALKRTPEQLEIVFDTPLAPRQAERVRALFAERIKTRKPAAYLTHEAWQGEFRFYVDERVLVPRSYISGLLEDQLAPWVSSPEKIRTALDLCTGSGCLAILLAHAFPKASVDAADISKPALAVARRNIGSYQMNGRIRVVQSDLFSKLGGRTYDLIISNPPYVREAVMRTLPQEYRREPAIALAGGRDGLDLVRRMLLEAPQHLADGGILVVEVGHNRGRVERAFPRLPFTWLETSGGDDCVFLLTREELLAAQPASRRATAADPSRRRAATRRTARA